MTRSDTKPMFYFGVFCIVVFLIVVVRISFIAGMESERFDRYHANRKLQECLTLVGR